SHQRARYWRRKCSGNDGRFPEIMSPDPDRAICFGAHFEWLNLSERPTETGILSGMAEKDQSANMATAGPELSPLLALIEERSGISFGDSPEHDFTARVREHMTAKKLAHASALLRLVRDSNLEYDELLECLLAHPTWFLRSSSTFAVLEKKVLSEMHQRKFWENPRNLRIWSAGCATGEEPYSIAMTICDSLEFASAWNIHILATDISRASLQQAERGLYPLHSLGALTARQKET